jgi:hypothetical protein
VSEDLAYRPARLDDAAEIHELLLRFAPLLGLRIETLEREEALYALVRNCARSGESWVASNAAGAIVGFVLAEPNQFGRHYAENEVIDVRHAAMAPDHRGGGSLAGLIGNVTARLQPVTVRVGAQDRTGLSACLQQLGFRQTGSSGGEQVLRWNPGAQVSAANTRR